VRVHRVTLIPGDGIGPELSEATRRVLEATGVGFSWDVQEAGASAMDRFGTPLPEQVLGSIRTNGVALKGPIATPPSSGIRSVNVALRVALDLYACVRPSRTFPGARSRYEHVDVVVVRENTEGMYTGIEFEQGEPATAELIAFIERTTGQRIRDDAGISIKTISTGASERIARFAFDYARSHGRSKVTAGHKANIMKFSDGVFLETARHVASEYPDVEFDDRIIDALTMHLVQRPEEFDVLLLPNLYGDILSDLCAGLVGGLGLAPGANLGWEYAVFEPVHGSAPDIAGRGRANPVAMILSAAMMLRHLGEGTAALSVEAAVDRVLSEGRVRTPDLGGTASTDDVAEAGAGAVRPEETPG
jgi:isocitrate dehydrogenase (NAD+)